MVFSRKAFLQAGVTSQKQSLMFTKGIIVPGNPSFQQAPILKYIKTDRRDWCPKCIKPGAPWEKHDITP